MFVLCCFIVDSVCFDLVILYWFDLYVEVFIGIIC